MKKVLSFISISVVLLIVGQTPVYCTDYAIDPPPSVPKNTVSNAKPKKEGVLSKIFSKKKKKQPAVFDSTESGYKGDLPHVQSEFKYKAKPKETIKDDGSNAEDYTPEEFQKSKIEDPLFLDVILNKARPSQYNIDMIRVMRFLETFRPIVENHEDIQKFNANVNLLDLHARRIEKLYKDKPESQSPSYWRLQDLAYKAKVLGNLKYDANYYSKFSPITGTKYAPDNILEEDVKLLLDLDKTVFEIRQLDN